MSLNYSFDILDLYKVEQNLVLLLSGWCIDSQKGIPTVYLVIDDRSVLLDYVPMNRVDVCKSYNLDSSFSKCGFRVRKELSPDIHSFKIIAEINGDKKTLISKEGNTLKQFIKESSIAYDIEEVTKSKDSGMYHFRGWAFSFENSRFKKS